MSKNIFSTGTPSYSSLPPHSTRMTSKVVLRTSFAESSSAAQLRKSCASEQRIRGMQIDVLQSKEEALSVYLNPTTQRNRTKLKKERAHQAIEKPTHDTIREYPHTHYSTIPNSSITSHNPHSELSHPLPYPIASSHPPLHPPHSHLVPPPKVQEHNIRLVPLHLLQHNHHSKHQHYN